MGVFTVIGPVFPDPEVILHVSLVHVIPSFEDCISIDMPVS